jgi:RNA polymerase sigma factor (sigma-70 family)
MSKDRPLTMPVFPAVAHEDGSNTHEQDLCDQATRLFDQHADHVYRYVVGTCRHDADARDATQEAFLRLYEALTRGEGIEAPAAWLRTVARRLMLDRLKSRKHEAEKHRDFGRLHADTGALPADAGVTQSHRAATLRRALATLSDLERSLLRGRARGWTLHAIGAQVGIEDIRKVSHLIQAAIKKLQEQCRD